MHCGGRSVWYACLVLALRPTAHTIRQMLFLITYRASHYRMRTNGSSCQAVGRRYVCRSHQQACVCFCCSDGCFSCVRFLCILSVILSGVPWALFGDRRRNSDPGLSGSQWTRPCCTSCSAGNVASGPLRSDRVSRTCWMAEADRSLSGLLQSCIPRWSAYTIPNPLSSVSNLFAFIVFLLTNWTFIIGPAILSPFAFHWTVPGCMATFSLTVLTWAPRYDDRHTPAWPHRPWPTRLLLGRSPSSQRLPYRSGVSRQRCTPPGTMAEEHITNRTLRCKCRHVSPGPARRVRSIVRERDRLTGRAGAWWPCRTCKEVGTG